MADRAACAFGKVIVLGEHAVVHGHPALAAALDRGVQCEAEPAPGGTSRLIVPDWDIDTTLGPDRDTTLGPDRGPDRGPDPASDPVRQALAALCQAAGLTAPVTLRCRADLPPAAGLGSSAALSVAVARALLGAAGRDAGDDAVAEVADAGERCFHRDPSGVDVALACRGGAGLFRRGAGVSPLPVAPLELVIGLSGEPRRTADLVARVAAALAADPAKVGARLTTLGQAAERGAAAWLAFDLAALGAEMNLAQRELAALGVSTPGLDALVASARAAGALGAKLTGAGGGGAVIALATEPERVAERWRSEGREVFTTAVGGAP